MSKYKTNLEKEFDFFVRNLPKLEAVEFGGIAKILGVALYKQIGVEDLSIEELKNMSDEEFKNLSLYNNLNKKELLTLEQLKHTRLLLFYLTIHIHLLFLPILEQQ